MIRLATPDDINAIAEGLYAFGESTPWKHQYRLWPSRPEARRFLTQELTNPKSFMLVNEDVTVSPPAIMAFCGVVLGQNYLPPHTPTVSEWGWYGPPKLAVALWLECVKWGKEHGAEVAGRGVMEPDTNPKRLHEHIIWKVL